MRDDETGGYGDAYARAQPGRSRAFKSAARHSARVKWLRRLILGGAALTTIGVLGYSWLRPLDRGDAHFSLDSFGISGDKVTMEHPRMTGVRRDGRPFEVTADTGVQSPSNPNRTTLTKLDARLHMSDDGVTHITGDSGVYDADAQTLDLGGHVHVISGGNDLAMRSAAMNFKTNAMVSKAPVRLDMSSGWVTADELTMADNGGQITFTGNVQSQFTQTDDASGAAAN